MYDRSLEISPLVLTIVKHAAAVSHCELAHLSLLLLIAVPPLNEKSSEESELDAFEWKTWYKNYCALHSGFAEFKFRQISLFASY